MDNTNTPEPKKAPGKKELRKQLADKIAAAVPELKTTLGEKKFDNRIKKAAKLMTEGMHKKERTKAAKKIKTVKSASVKKVAAKKKAKSAKKAE